MSVTLITALIIASNIAFTLRDDWLTENSLFAISDSEVARTQIAQRAKQNGALTGSGVGITIAAQESKHFGATQWIISPDGIIHGSALQRGLSVLLTPQIQNEKIIWKCELKPERAFQRFTCRFLSNNAANKKPDSLN